MCVTKKKIEFRTSDKIVPSLTGFPGAAATVGTPPKSLHGLHPPNRSKSNSHSAFRKYNAGFAAFTFRTYVGFGGWFSLVWSFRRCRVLKGMSGAVLLLVVRCWVVGGFRTFPLLTDLLVRAVNLPPRGIRPPWTLVLQTALRLQRQGRRYSDRVKGIAGGRRKHIRKSH